MIYISQSYFGIPKTIRINSQYVVFGRNLTQRDFAIICRDFPSDIPVKEFIVFYKRITSEKMSTMAMDIIGKSSRMSSSISAKCNHIVESYFFVSSANEYTR